MEALIGDLSRLRTKQSHLALPRRSAIIGSRVTRRVPPVWPLSRRHQIGCRSREGKRLWALLSPVKFNAPSVGNSATRILLTHRAFAAFAREGRPRHNETPVIFPTVYPRRVAALGSVTNPRLTTVTSDRSMDVARSTRHEVGPLGLIV